MKKLGIKTVRDLLWHFPVRYEDYTEISPIAEIGGAGQKVNIVGRVDSIKLVRSWRRRMAIITAMVSDDSGDIRAVWFNQPYLLDTLKEGTTVSLAGKVSADKKGLYLSSPSYEKISALVASRQSLVADLKHTGRLVPVYPETEGLTSKYLRFLIKPLLDRVGSLPDPLPTEIVSKYKFPKIADALTHIHFPEKIEQTEAARQRFAFEELLLFQLRALRDHRQLQTLKAPVIKFDKNLIANFVKSLPFELTNDQRIAAYEILQDLERNFPMNRLLNGDVGSGKTVVALIAAYQVVNAGYQVVFMAPTEILARQHYQTIKSLLADKHESLQACKLSLGLLTGSEAKQFPTDEIETEETSKKLMHKKIADGEISIVIGTHAVIQRGVKFKSLGLVVIDEQHRFGVEQRMKLVKQSTPETRNQKLETNFVPHLLSMTATPIPRTLALTIYGDLDVSLIKEKPKGRQKIITKIVPHSKREGAHKFIDKQIEQGRQVFVICPRIEVRNERLDVGDKKPENKNKKVSQAKLIWADVKAVTEEYEKLSKKVFPHRRVSMLHGKMKSKEKEEIMTKFQNGHYDLLVSTSVVEVGVDVPNATLMMIESAERFGLAQLHQFRGRVGRGEHQSHCFLFTTSSGTPTTQRLHAMEKTDDGFQLAEADLKLRGPGEFTGIKQSGLPDFAMASLADLDLIKKARLEARLLLKSDPTLTKYHLLKERLNEMHRLVHFE